MKTAGLLMIMLSGVYLCSQRLKTIGKKLSVARGLCALLRYTKGQIERYSMPCGEILRRCPREILSLCGYERDLPPKDFSELYCSLEIADEKADRIFLDFARDIGSSYRSEQVRRCEEFLELMNERERDISSRQALEKKLTVTLSVSAVLALLILAM